MAGTSSALPPELARLKLDRLIKTFPVVALALPPVLRVLFKRAFKRHPRQWHISQELACAFFEAVFKTGDIATWRHALFLVARIEVLEGTFKRVHVERVRQNSWLVSAPGAQAAADVVLLYLHGGCFVAGTPLQNVGSFAHWVNELADRGVNAKVLAVGYPLAPEHPFPAALDAAAELCDWLAIDSGLLASGKLVVGGDSAGANLALAALTTLRDGATAARFARRRPDGLLLLSPAVDVSRSAAWWDAAWVAAQEPGADYLPASVLGAAVARYAPDALLTDPRVSPIYAESFQGLTDGEMLVVAGGGELIIRDVERFVAKARAQGVALVYHKEPHQPHSYAVMGLPALLPLQGVVIDYLERVVRGGGGEGGAASSSAAVG